MISEGCLCDAPATVGLQSQSCGQPMIATAMAFIGFSLQSICIPPFRFERQHIKPDGTWKQLLWQRLL